jgi:transposase
VEKELLRGAVAHGFSSDLWTLKRIAVVVERLTGHHFSEGHMWRVLRAMNWSAQRPRRQASERDDEALERWRTKEWARIKKRQTP